jgi:hypothetical protein
MRCLAMTERLKAKEAIVKTSASAQEGVRIGDAAQELERVEAALGATILNESGSGGLEPGSTKGTLKAVEVGKAKTSTRDVGQAGVKESKEVVEAPQDAGKKDEQPELEEPQPQQQQQQ